MEVDIEAEAEMILKAEQELVELRWSLQRARSEAEQQVDDLMKEVKTNQEALAKTEPELAKEIKETAEKIKEVKAEKAAEEAAAKEHEAAVAAGRAKEEEERQVAVADFLKKYGFKSVNSPKRSLLWSSYALHKAAKQGDARMVEFLLLEGAVKDQKDSSGKTPAQIAKAGKHTAVLRVLDDGSRSGAHGGA